MPRSHRARLRELAPLLAAVLAASCGGDGSDDAGPPAPAAATLGGVAATGAALAQAEVAVTDGTKASVCVERAIVTSGTGAFTCTLQPGKTAPFVVVVTDPSGAHRPLVSVATTTPAAGEALVVNATPLTTAIVAQLAPGDDALAVVADRALLDLAALAAVKAKVLSQLAPVLTALGADAGYDPFATPIVAATAAQAGNTADHVMDLLRFSVVDGQTLVATVDRPDAAVALADAAATSPAALPPPAAVATTLSEATRLLAARLNGCFALPVSRRVLDADRGIAAGDGGPEVLSSDAACGGIAASDYRHNGYRFGQQFYGLLNDERMTGASFSPAEVMLLVDDTGADDHDRAVVNLRFVDAAGVAGNVITVMDKRPGSATTARPGDWWLAGNQHLVDASVRPFVRRHEQLAPNPGTGAFVNAAASRFESGITVFVNKDGPNSAGLRAALVTGPGLPAAGLVLTRPHPSICTAQNWLNILRKDGATDTASAVYAGDTTNIFRLQRTQGIAGSDATTLRPNPNAGNANATAFPSWAHPLDYGAQPGATGYIDFAALKAHAAYRLALYYDGEETPRHVETKTMLAPVVPATRGAALQWIEPTAATRAVLDPAGALAAAQTTVTLAWTANPLAETVQSAGFYSYGPGGSVNQGQVGVARGATSAVAQAPGNAGACDHGAQFAPLTADGTSGRSVQLRYRMLDGSAKDATLRWN